MERLGEQIQELRRQRELTLRALSRQSGFSVSFLSQVERGLSSLSISSLRAVADALGVDLSYFFPPPVHTNYVTRTTERKSFTLQGSSIAYVSLGGSFPARTLEPLLVTIPPRQRVSEPFAHPGEEFAYVLKGALTLWIDGKRHTLRPGDGIHFSARVRHSFENAGRHPVVAVWVTTPKLF